MESTTSTSVPNAARNTRRVDWVDGVRGAAAMFVVLHHTWLSVWPAFPRNIGPWWVGWMLYGHLAVAVFIVVSGFSLSLAPMRRGDTLSGGTRRFIGRRAWRILPPYWAALIVSTVISWVVLQPSVAAGTVTRGFFVHGLLLQDIVGGWIPNGAFWSIAIEWQIYFLFPLILFLCRKTSIVKSVGCTVALVLLAQELTRLGSPLSKIHHLTPQFLALFALGVLAAHLGHNRRALKLRRPLMAVGLGALAVVAALAVTQGSVWMVRQYFSIDLVFGMAIACLFTVMFSGGLPRLRGVLASRVALKIGLFSYSIYLLHGPLVGLFRQYVFGPMHLAPLVTFGLMVALAIPAILVLCYAFHLMFEAPFLRCRGIGAFREMPIIAQLLASRGHLGTTTPASNPPATEAVAAHKATP